MKEQIKKVEQFSNSFNIPVNEKPTEYIPLNRKVLRYDLMKEENEEYFEAAKKRLGQHQAQKRLF